ncbi:chondroitinase-B domain-containing protein [Polyangium aurulentum]|uniref:chondroitinase-B domain-containing protein n=1 Tax=Polyangium aurulentum TaxID=2567896 RepID=UPI00198060A5|nr:chondroitinase-B domain-containing protein [Polyangium aurulentum]UQA58305.1 hypothetical protein E8A73_044845 [Polyangium aurulentum]
MHKTCFSGPVAALSFAAVIAAPSAARAAETLSVVEVKVDRPTHHVLGLQVLIADDDDRDATISIRYREEGAGAWRNAMPLLRAWPDTVSLPIAQQFAGSIFDLEPGKNYEIELHMLDPDGVDETQTVIAKTREIPRFEPQTPNAVAVSDAAGLAAALAAAKPGDVITLADGTYAGSFFAVNASGTAENPIVVRGASQNGVVLDGEGCTGCNILEVYGSHVHVERMTLRNGERAVRFQGVDATGNVARRLRIEDVVHGVAGRPGQTDFTICDNEIVGRLVWPWTFAPDATSHWDDRGVDVTGDGHVICHNRLIGFGDPIVNKKSMSRSWDVYGNDIRDSFDGTELDESEGNARLFHNRYTNVMDPISIQPVRGGPVYVLRNIVMNAPEEQIKLKSLAGTDEPSGAIILHNTFVSARLALNLQAPITQHNFEIQNNLFVGPDTLASARTVDWTAKLDGGRFDFNGYYPDGGFWFGNVNGANQVFDSFAAVKASGTVEPNGVLLGKPIFASGIVGPTDAMAHQEPPDVSLAVGSNALDVGKPMPGINEGFVGAGPDLGAIEQGCPAPFHGPRPEGQEHVTNLVDCKAGGPSPGAGAGGGGAGGGGAAGAGGNPNGEDGGCACSAPGGASEGAQGGIVLLLGLLLGKARRRAS